MSKIENPKILLEKIVKFALVTIMLIKLKNIEKIVMIKKITFFTEKC